MPLCVDDGAIEEASNVKTSCLIEMEELDIADGNKASVTIDKASVRSIGSQMFFGDKSAGFFEDIEQLKEVMNPVQFHEKKHDEDTAVMIVEYATDVDA